MIKNLYRSSCKVPTRYSCPILMKFEFCDSFSNTTHISNFIRIRPVGVELFRVNRRADGRTEGRTDMTKLMVAFHNFAKAPKSFWDKNQ